ncbi:MAG: RnfABCDGE type electron transport complex subunit B [Melioribacteraceae bacterium]|nr:RnfABCDGE type electron transport complex subunit B [Melioribacteraceae bacterium]
MEIIIAILTLGGLGFIFAGGLAFADKKLKVEENPLIAEVNQYLPNANCGGCGKAGCYDFAVNVVEGKIEINKCPVCNDEARNEIAKLLGQEISTTIKKIPIIHCQGGNSKANKKEVDYIGPKTCKTINLISGGENLCYYGCLGAGDCVNACQFGALLINNDGLPQVIEELCTGCGICVKSCPRNLIELHPIDRNIFVYCKNEDEPKKAKEVCDVACIGCGICARKSDGGIIMKNNLAIVVYDSLDISKIPIEKCSTGAIKKKELYN